MGRAVIGAGIVITAVGLVIWGVEALTGRTAGALPGDIGLRRGPVAFYFPVVTMILVSLALTIVLNLLFRRR